MNAVHTNARILEMTEAPVSALSTNATGRANKSKKRRQEDLPKDAIADGDDVGSKPSKEERREAKRLKKSTK